MRGHSKHDDAQDSSAEVLLARFRLLRDPSRRSTTKLDKVIMTGPGDSWRLPVKLENQNLRFNAIPQEIPPGLCQQFPNLKPRKNRVLPSAPIIVIRLFF